MSPPAQFIKVDTKEPAHIKKLVESIEALRVDPDSPVPRGYDVGRVKSMKVKGFPAYVLRLGGYRVFYGVDWEDKVIYLAKIGPREGPISVNPPKSPRVS
ncbi:hypothetical protein FH039_06620 [Thermococcus indicus]|uniref:Type II toxin-antitoxin system RelE/ParE family toxin n=1 Tax=Thermococcus indicus TaxID=2586643 RepID=A0A4Y5SKM0_9EURY|nr:hypothetical protein FH039_06620 [Thermococcus indicus]